MKVLSVFSLVIVFHVVVISLLLIQPGCQSQPSGQPSPADTAMGPSDSIEGIPGQPVAEFNSALPSTAINRPGFRTPERPVGDTRPEADTSLLTPVLSPVQDSLSLPTIADEYTVRKGDNLTAIAKRQGVSLGDLLKANNLTRSSTIFIGQKLVIPASSGGGSSAVTPSTSPAAPPAPGKQITVASGDTLGKIASRAGTTVQILKSLNNLKSDTIYIGQRLTLPDGSSVPSPGITSQPVRTPAVTTTAGSYTVQSGDTPSGIARKLGVSTNALMSANGISDPRKMRVGQVLKIPSGGTVPVQQASTPVNQPMQMRNEPAMTSPQPVISEPTTEDPMSILEALEDEDIPFAEVEVIEGTSQPGN